MPLVEALLLNPASFPVFGRRKRSGKKGPMARRKTRRKTSWRSLVKRLGVRKAAKQWRKRRKNTWPDHSRLHARAAKKGWRRRKSRRSFRFAANPRRSIRRSYRRRHNPFPITGRGGQKYDLIPSVETLKNAGIKGLGAVGSELVRATGYSIFKRDIQGASILEDAAGRVIAGALTGFIAGYAFGGKIGAAVVEGTYTVAMYNLIADLTGKFTGGSPKILGFIANPFKDPGKSLIPGFGSPALAQTSGMSGIMPEGDIVPLGAIMPEGEVVPLGEDESARMSSRF